MCLQMPWKVKNHFLLAKLPKMKPERSVVYLVYEGPNGAVFASCNNLKPCSLQSAACLHDCHTCLICFHIYWYNNTYYITLVPSVCSSSASYISTLVFRTPCILATKIDRTKPFSKRIEIKSRTLLYQQQKSRNSSSYSLIARINLIYPVYTYDD